MINFLGIKKFFFNAQEYLFYLLIFLLPLQTRWMIKLGELNGGYYEYGTYSLYAFDILLIGLLVYWFIINKYQVSSIKYQVFWWFVGGLELFIFISIFFAVDLRLAFYGYGRFLLGVSLFFLVANLKYDKIKIYWALVFSGALQSFLAMWQFASQSVYGSKWFGIASQSGFDLGVSVVDNGFRRYLRSYGSFPHPNILGGFLAICLLVNIILYIHLHRKAESGERKAIKNKSASFALYFFIINLIGLLFTFSRGAWLGFLAGFIIIIFSFVFISKDKIKRKNILGLAMIVLAISIIFALIYKEPVVARLNLNNRLEIKSLEERANYNQDAWKIIRKNWFFGVGIKNYGLAVKNEIDEKREAYYYEPVHNTFLLVWAEIGILGLLFFISLLVYLFAKSLNAKQKETVALIFALTVMMIFDHWWWSMPFGVYLFWLIIGLSLYKIKN